ncbi:hypothetical protein [Staphylococcus hominis]|uniref:hypothetical protein n=1 Tax=Staphylococcus hominis TaxID=1290 RepID=UPI003DA05780
MKEIEITKNKIDEFKELNYVFFCLFSENPIYKLRFRVSDNCYELLKELYNQVSLLPDESLFSFEGILTVINHSYLFGLKNNDYFSAECIFNHYFETKYKLINSNHSQIKVFKK